MLKLLFVGLGGFAGAVARYALSGYVQRLFDGRFPYGTLTVNVLGSFLLGFLMYLVESRGPFGPNIRPLISIGFLGALTTYSTFAWETYGLVVDQRFLMAGVNTLLQLVVGLGAVWVGVTIGQIVSK